MTFVVCVVDPFCLLFKYEYTSCSILKISLRYGALLQMMNEWNVCGVGLMVIVFRVRIPTCALVKVWESKWIKARAFSLFDNFVCYISVSTLYVAYIINGWSPRSII